MALKGPSLHGSVDRNGVQWLGHSHSSETSEPPRPFLQNGLSHFPVTNLQVSSLCISLSVLPSPGRLLLQLPGTYLPLGCCWAKRLTGFTCRNTAGLSLLLRPVRKAPLSMEALRGNLTKTDWVTARKIRVYKHWNSLAKATKQEANPDTRFLQAWGVSTQEQPLGASESSETLPRRSARP